MGYAIVFQADCVISVGRGEDIVVSNTYENPRKGTVRQLWEGYLLLMTKIQ